MSFWDRITQPVQNAGSTAADIGGNAFNTIQTFRHEGREAGVQAARTNGAAAAHSAGALFEDNTRIGLGDGAGGVVVNAASNAAQTYGQVAGQIAGHTVVPAATHVAHNAAPLVTQGVHAAQAKLDDHPEIAAHGKKAAHALSNVGGSIFGAFKGKIGIGHHGDQNSIAAPAPGVAPAPSPGTPGLTES